LLKKRSASLVVIQGRRRIGKSRLIEEFAKDHTFYQFSGMPPTKKTTIQSQLMEILILPWKYFLEKLWAGEVI
jgi:hypothetical protein